MSILDIVDDGIPVLDHMREPPIVRYMVLCSPGPVGDFEPQMPVDTLYARTDSEATIRLKQQARELGYGPGRYYAVRMPSDEDMVVVRVN